MTNKPSVAWKFERIESSQGKLLGEVLMVTRKIETPKAAGSIYLNHQDDWVVSIGARIINKLKTSEQAEAFLVSHLDLAREAIADKPRTPPFARK